MSETLGPAIAVARKKLGWTRADLAGILQIGLNTVGSWETDRNLPRPDMLVEIEKAFKWPRGYTLAIIAGEVLVDD